MTLLNSLAELLDIPTSYYELAEDRYKSLGEWFHRENSAIAQFDPQVYPQGSFRYGTVIRPWTNDEQYDLDLVCQLALPKAEMSQKELKELVGSEVKSYADAHNFKKQAREKKRCWRLDYADAVSFHMDILPAVPDDPAFKRLLCAAGVPVELADLAVAITDIRHRAYCVIDQDWPRSNPKGFAKWFEGRMAEAASARRRMLVENRAYASVDDVPPYEWKTPLQRAIQLLKRHRDVMFQDSPDLKPISMIITTLAARAYGGERDLEEALTNILDQMLDYVLPTAPKVENPVNPAEDFADRWTEEPRLEENFRAWHRQATSDFAGLRMFSGAQLETVIEKRLNLEYDNSRANGSTRNAAAAVPAVHISPTSSQIIAPPSPWAE